jgi:uncharacterized protein (DUF1800 family)
VLRNELKYFSREFDSGAKRILGQRGDWNARDTLQITLDQPPAARSIVRRLYRWLVSETDEPSDDFLQPLCATFRQGFEIRDAVAQILRSNWFFSASVYRRRVKGPVEFAAGLIRAMEATVPTLPLAGDLAGLGQSLYAPPTLSGWSGGRHWLNPATLIARSNLAAALLSRSGPYGGRLDPAALAADYGYDEFESAARWLGQLLLPGQARASVETLAPACRPEADGGNANEKLRAVAHRWTASPEFQLA